MSSPDGLAQPLAEPLLTGRAVRLPSDLKLWDRIPFIGRLLFTASLAILVAGTAMVFVSSRQEAAEIRDDLRIALAEELVTLPAALAETVVIGDFATLQQMLDRYAARPLVRSVRFRDSSGTVLTSAAPPPPAQAPAWFLGLFDFADADGSAVVQVGGRSYGELSLALSSAHRAERAWGHLKNHMAILLLAVLVDFIGIWLVLRSGLKPLEHLEAGARAMAAGRLDVALNPEGSPELRSLIDSFNHMIEAVHQGQSALRQSEERLSYVLAATGEGIWDWNIPADTVTHNAQWGRLVGLTEVPPSHPVAFFLERIHPEDRETVTARIGATLNGQGPYQSEHRLVGCDGRTNWVLDRGQVVERDPQGRPLRMVGSIADITGRKANEAEIADQRRRLAYIIEGTNVGTWEWDLPSGTITINERWAQIIGYRLADLQPTTLATWTGLVHPEDLRRSDELLQQHFAGALPYYECEVRMRHRSGHWVWVLDRGRLANRDAEGQPLLMSGTHQDISARKAAETALLEAKTAAEAANLAKSRFLATMSHEIRTPLNGVLGMAQLLMQPQVSEAERLDFAAAILSCGETLLKLLNDILDLSKVEAGRVELEPTAFAPAELLTEVRALFGAAARAKGLRLEVEWSGVPGARYACDIHRLRQMLANLVGNAIKFTDHGEVRITAAELRREGTRAMLDFAVSDTGIGIAKDRQTQLFQPFVQIDNTATRNYSGSGLGLSIVRNLAELMGGGVALDSEPGKGSCFRFRIPADLTTADTGPPGALHPLRRPGSAPAAAPPPARILVVEDNFMNRKVIVKVLERLGMDVAVAEDGQQALAAVTAGDPARLVLMDVQMPVMDGYTATRRIREWEQDAGRPRLPIVALTANAFEEDAERCLAAGMDDFLTKPVAFEDLRTVLARWLRPDGTDACK